MFLLVALFLFQPADLSAARHAEPVPAELTAAVAGTILSGGVRATAGATTVTFWFVKDLGAGEWSGMQEGTLVGAAKIDKDFRDIRGRVIKAGTFTMRYGLQPANGDHLGVSPYREFLLLSPADLDTDPAPRGHDGTVELSKEAIGGSHPAVLSVDPPVSTAAPLSITTTELGHKAVVLEIPSASGALRFGLVLAGKIEA